MLRGIWRQRHGLSCRDMPHLLRGRYATGQTRGEALVHTFMAGAIGEESVALVASYAGPDDFRAQVRRDMCSALLRQLHRLRLDSASKTAYDTSVLYDMDLLAQSDASGYVPRLAQIQDWERDTCRCAFSFSAPETNTAPPLPNPVCPYITELQRNDASSGDAPHANSVPDHKTWDSLFANAMNQKMRMRRLARTKNGYLGLVPDSAEIGEAVWLLEGGRVPYVLRSVGAACEEREWEVVGEAYVHGVMHGDAWEELDGGDVVLVDIV
jgi:hypothetical protein